MAETKLHCIRVLLALGCLMLTGLSACPPAERFEGTYVAIEDESSPHAGAVLELKDDSQGVFKSREQEVSFRWGVRESGVLLFHTKEGGVITGKLCKDTLTITFPSDRVMVFKKKPAY